MKRTSPVARQNWGVLTEQASSRALDRDVLLLMLLTAIAIGLFLLTRNIAAREQQMEIRVAAIWYARGERQMDAGAIEGAIDSFRKAVSHDRDNREYAFALADGLAAGNHNLEAAQTVLRLRELDPEDAQINLVLAGLASKRGDLSGAVHYFENAIYGRWMGAQVDERRRQVRIELIEFLLAHEERDRALSELLILESDLPHTAAPHVQTGELFLQAGDPQHALKNFSGAIKLSPHDPAALAGAGEASFDLGNYVEARHYLKASLVQNNESSRPKQLLSLVNSIQSSDPLAPHLSLQVRQERLLADYEQALRRLQNCIGQRSVTGGNSNLRDLEAEANKMKPHLQLQSIRHDVELVRSGVDLIYRMETASNMACGATTGPDEALLLIARKHSGKQ